MKIFIIFLMLFLYLSLKKIFKTIKKLITPYLDEWKEMFIDWRFGVCYLLAWALLHVPIYLGIAIGLLFKITWLSTISSSIYAILWLPFCNEYILQIPIAIFIKKVLFPKNKQGYRFLFKKNIKTQK